MEFRILFIFFGFISFAISTFLSYSGIEPVRTLYYIFAWWSYIFFLDGINGILKGNSLIIDRTKHFFFMLPFSAALWFFFELMNIRLQNWAYQALPFDKTMRHTGYILSYATVFPAILETKELVINLRLFSKLKIRALDIKETYLNPLFFSGIFLFILILIFPKILFPFTWIFLFMITEPINYKLKAFSLIREARSARWDNIFATALAGFICGFLWEMWNYNSGAKWTYNFPLAELLPKIFEMPLHGYLGFPLFAIECYSFLNLVFWLKNGEHWENQYQKNHNFNNLPLYVILILLIPLYVASMNLIDGHTVKYFILL